MESVTASELNRQTAEVLERYRRLPARLRRHPQRPGDDRRDRVRVGDRGQLGQPHPVAGSVEQFGGHLQAQPGLPGPAGPRSR